MTKIINLCEICAQIQVFFSVLYKKTLNLYLFFNKIITFAIIFALCMQIQRTATI